MTVGFGQQTHLFRFSNNRLRFAAIQRAVAMALDHMVQLVGKRPVHDFAADARGTFCCCVSGRWAADARNQIICPQKYTCRGLTREEVLFVGLCVPTSMPDESMTGCPELFIRAGRVFIPLMFMAPVRTEGVLNRPAYDKNYTPVLA